MSEIRQFAQGHTTNKFSRRLTPEPRQLPRRSACMVKLVPFRSGVAQWWSFSKALILFQALHLVTGFRIFPDGKFHDGWLLLLP